jgi:uncharacterized protein HemY
MVDKFKVWTSMSIDIRTHMENQKQVAEQTSERIIKLMVIFLLQTLILPVVMLWILWGLIRGVFDMPRVT